VDGETRTRLNHRQGVATRIGGTRSPLTDTTSGSMVSAMATKKKATRATAKQPAAEKAAAKTTKTVVKKAKVSKQPAAKKAPAKQTAISERDLRWNEYFWTKMVSLPSWRDFRCQGRARSSSSKVELVFAPEGRDDAPLQESEVALVRWALRNESKMQRELVKTLLGGWAKARERYVADGGEPKLMPPVRKVDDLKRLIELRGVNVHQLDKDGIPYVGFILGCTWDAEHGLGVLMHGTRVVEIGGADTAILLWIAKRDAKKN
jgi:hypothetical protein